MYLNRTVAVVTLKPPFADWLNSNAEASDQVTFDEISEVAHVVLLPEETLEDNEITIETLNQFWLKIARHVFNEWDNDSDLWPKKFTLEDFEKWFDLAIIDSPVADLVDEELIAEPSED